MSEALSATLMTAQKLFGDIDLPECISKIFGLTNLIISALTFVKYVHYWPKAICNHEKPYDGVTEPYDGVREHHRYPLQMCLQEQRATAWKLRPYVLPLLRPWIQQRAESDIAGPLRKT